MKITEEQSERIKTNVGIDIQPGDRFVSRLHRKLVEVWGDEFSTPFEPGQCRVCGRRVLDPEPENVEGLGPLIDTLQVTVCSDCQSIVDEHYDQKLDDDSEAMLRWYRNCPPLYREAVESGGLPFQNSMQYRELIRWRPERGKGLVITGDSGDGKTTAIWHLAKDLEKEGHDSKFVTAVELARVLARSAKELESNKELLWVPVLIIDDLGKEKVTATGSAMLWELLQHRIEHRRPTIVSTRYKRNSLVERFGDQEMGQDIVGRLVQFCDAIRLPTQKREVS